MISRRSFVKGLGITILSISTLPLLPISASAASTDRKLTADEIVSLYQDAINNNRISPIEISDYKILDIDSVGGVTINISWLNTSGKTIKYIYFSVTPYNRVNDVQRCTIKNKSTIKCQVTGPIESSDDINGIVDFKKRIEDGGMIQNQQGKFLADLKWEKPYWNGSQAYYLKDVVSANSSTQKDVPFILSPKDFMGQTFATFAHGGQNSGFSKVWYNNDIESFAITAIHIDYMDGSSEDVNPASVILDWEYRQTSIGYRYGVTVR